MNVLLGVSGSISAYKALDLCREITKQGHQVKVILTHGALNFVKAETFRYLGATNVYLPTDDFQWQAPGVLHVDLAKWGETFLLYPLSANTLADIVGGKAQNLLLSTLLVWKDKPLIFYPAMNTSMYHHPFVKKNIEALAEIAWGFVHPPISGELACGDIGEGKLPRPEVVAKTWHLFQPPFSAQKKVLITTGATISALDPVRYLTNASSGKTGLEIAKSYLKRNYDVHIVAGKNATQELDELCSHPLFHLTRVASTYDMKVAVDQLWPSSDIFIAAAAVNDLSFPVNFNKLKKEDMQTSLTVEINPDILKGVIANKSQYQKVVGFAAETNTTKEQFIKKWHDKQVDLLVCNPVHHGHLKDSMPKGFNRDDGDYTFIINGQVDSQKTMSKKQLAESLFERIH